jgi:hypothetical protein
MKRVGKKLWKPVPKRDDCILKRHPFSLDITLWAKIKDTLLSILIDNPCLNTISAVIDFTVWTNPLCRLGGMVMARCPHKTPSNGTFSF